MIKSVTLSALSIVAANVGAFAPLPTRPCHSSAFAPSQGRQVAASYSRNPNDVDVDVDVEGYTSLTDDGGVKIRLCSSSPAASIPPSDEPSDERFRGKDVTVEYVGTIAPRSWSVSDVVACWLPDRGLSPLAPDLFEAFEIDGARLANAKKFTRKFVFEGLGVLKEAKIDALLGAAADLTRSEKDHPPGTVFDKNRFTFRPGKGMSIRAFDLAVREMEVGQTASVVARCDYAYGAQGLRMGGKVLVPPYATTQYDITIVDIK